MTDWQIGAHRILLEIVERAELSNVLLPDGDGILATKRRDVTGQTDARPGDDQYLVACVGLECFQVVIENHRVLIDVSLDWDVDADVAVPVEIDVDVAVPVEVDVLRDLSSWDATT